MSRCERREVFSAAIKTYKISIFNRWGEKLWESNNSDEHWDGTYSSKLAQSDVYIYNVVFTDFKNKTYSLNGTVHLIR